MELHELVIEWSRHVLAAPHKAWPVFTPRDCPCCKDVDPAIYMRKCSYLQSLHFCQIFRIVNWCSYICVRKTFIAWFTYVLRYFQQRKASLVYNRWFFIMYFNKIFKPPYDIKQMLIPDCPPSIVIQKRETSRREWPRKL